MSDTDPQSDRVGNDYREGVNPSPGGDIDTSESAIPPYDDRNVGRNERSEGPERMLSGEEPPMDTVQPESSAPYSGDAEMPPKGVGESTTRRGEDVIDQEGRESGRTDEGTQGQSDRPVGSSEDRDISGV